MATLYNYTKKNIEITDFDKYINQCINGNVGDNYSEILKKNANIDLYFHLSDLRLGLFSWYDFKPNSVLLEIGGGYGALTGYFCKKCATVTTIESSFFRAHAISERYKDINNLTIYDGDIKHIDFKRKFDYVVLVNNSDMQLSSAYLKYIKTLLNPNGILLLAIDNRLGLKYFCGDSSSYIKAHFSDINSSLRLFSKNELINLLHNAGIRSFKFYYPLPDYKFPQLIYTDDYLPGKNLQERLIPYYNNPQNLIINEMDLYNDFIDNGVFSTFANSFLIECGEKENRSRAIYAALSTDRGRDKAFATVIYDNDVVKKAAVYDEGRIHTEKLYSNHVDLAKHNIPVIINTLKVNALWMKYIKAPMLMDYLRSHIDEQAIIISAFDKLYEYILSSSEHVSAEKNALLSLSTTANWGVILKKAYIELIPLNCFYENGEFLFFDQEYVRENYPAKYVLFRAIYYLFSFTSIKLSLDFFQDRYGINIDLWNIFVKEEENRFIHDVRLHDIYMPFRQKYGFNYKQVQKNMYFLTKGRKLQERYLFLNPQHKKIIAFGSGNYFLDYMNSYGKYHKPTFILDNAKDKWGKTIQGITIYPPNRLNSKICNEFYVIICIKNYAKIEEQLKNLGIEDYRIYML